jgi:two-component system response regulator HydG
MNEQEMNRHLKEIINTMNDGVMFISPDGFILMVNRALEEISGYTREEIVGRSCSVFHCDVCERARSGGQGNWCELFTGRRAHKKPCLLMRKDGSYVHVLKNASLLKDEAGLVLGAVETVTDISELDKREQRIEELSRLLEGDGGFHGMVGRSEPLRKVFEIIQKAAQSEAPVIIYGETGTGKELVAHAIHDLGKRRDGPYIQLNCAALNPALLESELFGHVKGAFTGAYSHRQGRFEASNGGDIFLDEIGDVPLSIQVKLLRTLETKQFERVGDHRPIRTDVRIITATNRDLEKLVREEKFREDLLFRINVLPIHLPPLRARVEDLPLLIEHFIGQLRARSGKEISALTPEAMDLFVNYPWPGNVRELKGVLEYAFMIVERGLIGPEHLPQRMLHSVAKRGDQTQSPAPFASQEKAALMDALISCGGNQTQAARVLGVNRVTVWHRVKKYGIDIRRLGPSIGKDA